jgi:hypothetical protein
MVIHVCPGCGKRHEVHPVLDQLAYGAQLACSGRCKQAYRQAAVARCQAESELRAATGAGRRCKQLAGDIE